MPELPEVETIKSGLERRVKGLTISNIEVRKKGKFIGDKKKVVGLKVKNVRRRAKVIIIDVSNNMSLMTHLKMTGQFVYHSKNEKQKIVGGHPQKGYNQPHPHQYSHIIITFTSGDHLYFNDLRRFGWMEVIKTADLEKHKAIKDAGPEPLGKEFKNQKAKIKNIMKKSKIAIKSFLVDQKNLAGIGNIYSDEILYEAGIRSDRLAMSLSDIEIDKLFKAIPKVLKKALACGGTSDSTYVGVDGERGNYLQKACAYHKKEDPKGHKIERKKIGGRTAHFCPICQK